MSKTRDTGFLNNVIKTDPQGNVTIVSGSTTLLSISSSGAVTTTGVISGSNALTSSYSQNSELLDGLDSTSFVFTSSYNLDSSSFSTRTTTLEQASASFAVVSQSYSAASGSFSGRITTIESKYATTGSNIFTANQTICGNLTTTGTITAQTINVQQVTSSVVYSSGSNIFGCSLSNTQQMTGSVTITGSLVVQGPISNNNNACFTSVCSPTHVGGTFSGTTVYGSTVVCGATICSTGNTCFGGMSIVNSCLGIGTVAPTGKLQVNNSSTQYALYSTQGNLELYTPESNCGYVRLGSAYNLNGIYGNLGLNYIIESTYCHIFRTQSTALMTITSGGNVGIGTSSPTCKLEVDGGSSAVGLRISTTNTGAGVAALILANSSKSAFNDGMIMAHGGGYTNITTLSGATIMAWDMSNCRVGIGTTSPTGLLEVYKSTSGGLGGHIILNNNGTAVGNETAVIFQDGGVGSVRAAISSTTEGAPYAGDIKFKTGLTSYGSLSTRMIITGAGNVGIGTCTPNFALEVCKTDGSVRFGTNTRHVLFCTQTLTGNISYTGFRYDDNGLVEVVKLLNNYSGTGYGNAIGFYGNGDKQMGYIKVSQTDASNTQAKMVIGVRCNDGAYDALSIFQGAVSCFAGQVCVASFTQGGGQSGNGFRKYISFGSAFNNPNQGLFNITSISTNSVLVAKVTVYQTAFGARASNVHTGYAMYYWDGCTTCAMSVEGNLGIGSVGTLAWCSSCLTYTANRVSNYDSYQVEVNWGGSSGNINLTWLA